MKQYLNTKLSQDLFGNTLGLRVNLLWEYYALLTRFRYGVFKGILTSTHRHEVKQLKRKGFATIAVGNVDELSQKVSSVFEKDKYKDKTPYIEIEKSDVHLIAEPLFKVLKENASVLKSYYKTNYQVYWSSIQRTITGALPVTTSYGWHLDDNPLQLLKLFIYLNDVKEINGAFRAFDYADSKKLFQKGFISNSAENRAKSQPMVDELLNSGNISINILEGKKGTLLCFDNNLIHKGTLPVKGYRDVIQVEVYPASEELTYENVLNSLTANVLYDYPKNPFYNDLNVTDQN
jgi:hypothetical protein